MTLVRNNRYVNINLDECQAILCAKVEREDAGDSSGAGDARVYLTFFFANRPTATVCAAKVNNIDDIYARTLAYCQRNAQKWIRFDGSQFHRPSELTGVRFF